MRDVGKSLEPINGLARYVTMGNAWENVIDFQKAKSWRGRLPVILAVALVHVGLIILIFSLAEHARTIEPPPGLTILTVSSVPAPPEPRPVPIQRALPPPPPRAALPATVSPPVDVEPIMPAPAAPATATASADPDCAPLDMVAATLVSDPHVATAIIAAPPAVRSVAEAVVIWNKQWSEVAATPKAPLGPVRIAIERILATLPADCLAAPIAGPRLIQIPGAHGTTIFVFGSGRWAWSQMIAVTSNRVHTD